MNQKRRKINSGYTGIVIHQRNNVIKLTNNLTVTVTCRHLMIGKWSLKLFWFLAYVHGANTEKWEWGLLGGEFGYNTCDNCQLASTGQPKR